MSVSRWSGFLLVLCTTLVAKQASAIPAFARQTGMSCTSCHDAWPRLNDFGELYRDRGYKTDTSDEDSWARLLDTLKSEPISVRTTVGYNYSVSTNQPTDGGPKTVGNGGFAAPVGDIYFGAPLSSHVSAYLDIAGFGKDGAAGLESAWVRFNDLPTNWLNIKLGKLEQDLPLSMHRSLTIYAPFAVYDYHPTGSINGIHLSENQLGIELMGHNRNGPGLRYAVSFSTSSDAGAVGVFSAPSIYAHVTHTSLIASRVFSRFRVGAMGNVGWWPTKFSMLTPDGGGTPQPVAGTGSDQKISGRTGLDTQLTFGSLARPLVLTVAWMYGQEDTALIPAATRVGRFHGGFAQLDYTPILPLTFGVRYDGVYNIAQADPTQSANAGQIDSFSAFVRYSVWMSTWGGVAIHLEGNTTNTANASTIAGLPVRNTFMFAGVDLLL